MSSMTDECTYTGTHATSPPRLLGQLDARSAHDYSRQRPSRNGSSFRPRRRRLRRHLRIQCRSLHNGAIVIRSTDRQYENAHLELPLQWRLVAGGRRYVRRTQAASA